MTTELTHDSHGIAERNASGARGHHLATLATDLFMDACLTVTTHAPHRTGVKDIIGEINVVDWDTCSGSMAVRVTDSIGLTKLTGTTGMMCMTSLTPIRPDTVQGSTDATVFCVAAIGDQGAEDVVNAVAMVVLRIILKIILKTFIVVAMPRAIGRRWV